jgi:hypothetical protein
MAGSVVRATLDGEDRMVLGSATHPFDLALDDDDVFFSAEDSIRKVAKSGGASTPLITGTGATRGVALDATEVYYVDLALNDGDVERVSKGGGGELVLAPMQSSPRFLAVMDGLVYWTDDGAQTVSRTSVDGMGAVEPLASAQAGAWDVFATAELVVWTNLADVGEVKWLSLDDLMDERTLAFPVRPWGITVDDEYVYWTAEGDGTVQRSAVDGEQELAQVIADDQQQPHGIAVDGTFVYWADTQAGTIVRLTK